MLATSGVVNDPDNILGALEAKYGVKIFQNKEEEPLGTGATSPLSLAHHFLVVTAHVCTEWHAQRTLSHACAPVSYPHAAA